MHEFMRLRIQSKYQNFMEVGWTPDIKLAISSEFVMLFSRCASGRWELLYLYMICNFVELGHGSHETSNGPGRHVGTGK